jgi:hypothetical protein
MKLLKKAEKLCVVLDRKSYNFNDACGSQEFESCSPAVKLITDIGKKYNDLKNKYWKTDDDKRIHYIYLVGDELRSN